MTYSIEVKNFKSKSIELVIQDQIPVTQNAEISIEPIEFKKVKLNEPKEVVEWTVKLKSKETHEIEYAYKVKHNKGQKVVLY
jgi:hypothetical protein